MALCKKFGLAGNKQEKFKIVHRALSSSTEVHVLMVMM